MCGTSQQSGAGCLQVVTAIIHPSLALKKSPLCFLNRVTLLPGAVSGEPEEPRPNMPASSAQLRNRASPSVPSLLGLEVARAGGRKEGRMGRKVRFQLWNPAPERVHSAETHCAVSTPVPGALHIQLYQTVTEGRTRVSEPEAPTPLHSQRASRAGGNAGTLLLLVPAEPCGELSTGQPTVSSPPAHTPKPAGRPPTAPHPSLPMCALLRASQGHSGNQENINGHRKT